MSLDNDTPAENLVKSYVDITPGRPTIAEHRYPMGSPKYHVDFKKADIRTKLNTLITNRSRTANNELLYEHRINNYYTDLGEAIGYQEIAMMKEQQ